MLKKQNEIKSIICLRNDRFGEFLLNIPAFRALKARFPSARLVLAVDSAVKELAKAIDCVDEVIVWDNKKHSFFDILRLINMLRRKKFDLSVAFNPSKEFNIAAFFSGIPERLGYDHKLAFLLNNKLQDKKYLGERHEIEYNLKLAGLSGARADNKELSLKVDISLADPLLELAGLSASDKLIAIHPWTSDPVKQWPMVNFLELAERFAREPDIKTIVIGGPLEAVKAQEFCGLLKTEGVINFSGKTSLLQLGALLKRCGLLISGDSGPVHLASAVGTKVIAIFRSDMPGKTAKRWGPWGQPENVIEKDDLAAISAEEVFNKAKEVLKGL
jgi:heptosyltransferase II